MVLSPMREKVDKLHLNWEYVIPDGDSGDGEVTETFPNEKRVLRLVGHALRIEDRNVYWEEDWGWDPDLGVLKEYRLYGKGDRMHRALTEAEEMEGE